MNGLLGGMFGPMDEDPEKAAQRQGLLGMGAALLQAGGPSTTPISLGQALGQGVMTGQGMAQNAYMQALKMAELQKPKAENLTGEVSNIARSMFGTADVSKLTPEQRQYVMQKAQENRMATAQAGASNVSVKMGSTLGSEIAKAQVPLIQNSYNKANSANNTLNTISQIEGVIDNVFAGPGSTIQTGLARLGQQLGFGGSNQQETLNNTVSAMQGLAKLQLDAAQALQGQGQISDKERALVERAAGGDLKAMTKDEVKTLVNTLKKSSEFQIQQHNSLVDKTSTLLPEGQGYFNNFKVNRTKTKMKVYNPTTGKIEER